MKSVLERTFTMIKPDGKIKKFLFSAIYCYLTSNKKIKRIYEIHLKFKNNK